MQVPGDFDWPHAVAALVGAVGGTVGSIIAGVWKFKETIEQSERRMEAKVEASDKIKAAKLDEVERKLVENTKAMTQTLIDFEQQFRDTFLSLRQKINDVELNTEKYFISKHGFDGFLAEYRDDRKERREDMRLLMQKLERIEHDRKEGE